jgi:hypothetical protein
MFPTSATFTSIEPYLNESHNRQTLAEFCNSGRILNGGGETLPPSCQGVTKVRLARTFCGIAPPMAHGRSPAHTPDLRP